MYYHGSKMLVPKLERRQIRDREGNLFFGICITKDFGTALAMGGRPNGLTASDGRNHTIKFEDPNLFDPERDVYIYFIDISKIPEEKIVRSDEFEVAVLDDVVPVKVEKHKAGEVSQYFSII